MARAPTLASSRMSADERLALGGLTALLLVTAGWWALALWPVADAPGWLERTRYVCFGVLEDGLPDGGGWVGLIGSPLGMLALLLVGWRDGVHALTRRARTTPVLAGGLAALVSGALLIAAGGLSRVYGARVATDDLDPIAVMSAAEHARLDTKAPPLELIDHTGTPRTLAALRGRPVLLTFAYGHCNTICPLVVKQVLAARAVNASPAIPPAVLIVTVDPWRDVPSRLPAIAASWGLPDGHAWLLGGEVDAVGSALNAWNVPRQRDLRTGEITHPALVYIIDADGRIAFATTGGMQVLDALLRRL